MITILGAGGVISAELAKILSTQREAFRLVSRRGTSLSGGEVVTADLTDRDQTIRAVDGSSIVCVTAGLAYDRRVWAQSWPLIMSNAIEACKRSNAKLLFFDNVYAYGRTGIMTESTPYNPCSTKGEIRAAIATQLTQAWEQGSLTGMIVRAADFYGPSAATGIPNLLVFAPLSKGQSASVLANDAAPHSYTYTLDAAKGIAMLLADENAWNQTWHLPTAPDPLTARAFIEQAAQAFGVKARYRVLRPWMVRVFGLFDRTTSELYEMLYQNDAPYLFDSSKFAKAYGFAGTPYAQSIVDTAMSYTRPSP